MSSYFFLIKKEGLIKPSHLLLIFFSEVSYAPASCILVANIYQANAHQINQLSLTGAKTLELSLFLKGHLNDAEERSLDVNKK